MFEEKSLVIRLEEEIIRILSSCESVSVEELQNLLIDWCCTENITLGTDNISECIGQALALAVIMGSIMPVEENSVIVGYRKHLPSLYEVQRRCGVCVAY